MAYGSSRSMLLGPYGKAVLTLNWLCWKWFKELNAISLRGVPYQNALPSALPVLVYFLCLVEQIRNRLILCIFHLHLLEICYPNYFTTQLLEQLERIFMRWWTVSRKPMRVEEAVLHSSHLFSLYNLPINLHTFSKGSYANPSNSMHRLINSSFA